MTEQKTDNNPRRLGSVLVARFSALGDVAMTVPVLYSAARCYPDVEFTFVTRASMASIFVDAPRNLNVIGLNLGDYKGVGGLWRLFRRLRRETRFDAFIDLHDVLRTRMLRLFCRLSGIPAVRLNKGRKGKRALTRRNNKVLLPLVSSRARYRQAFHAMGLPVDSRFDGLYGVAGSKADPALFAAIHPPKAEGERWIGIAPFAKHEGKIYPPEMMEEVVDTLSADPRNHIFLFGGGEKESRMLGAWAERFPRTISLAGLRAGFPVELALVSQLDVMVSMDSANMHLASLVATPVVSVWGATHPYCGFKGWRQAEADIVQLPMTCRPCSVFGNKPCFRHDYHCLRGIKPQLIVNRVLAHLSANQTD